MFLGSGTSTSTRAEGRMAHHRARREEVLHFNMPDWMEKARSSWHNNAPGRVARAGVCKKFSDDP